MSKRAKLEGVAAADGGIQELVDLLQRLQTLLSRPGDFSDADGLDTLLEELARLQTNVDGSTQADAAFRAIADAQEKLQVGGCSPAAATAAAAAQLPPAAFRLPAAAACRS